MRVVKEEQFGPVIPIVKYRTVDEAIERANSLDVGLGGSVWGDDPQEAARHASRLECGTAWVNQHGTLHPMAPFGGVKCSGIGVRVQRRRAQGVHDRPGGQHRSLNRGGRRPPGWGFRPLYFIMASMVGGLPRQVS